MWALGVILGVALAISLGAYGPSWGVALAFPSVALLFSIGSWNEKPGEGQEITHLLRLTLGVTAGFLLTTTPITLARLGELGDAVSGENADALMAELDRLRVQLVLRWLVITLALPLGLAALWNRYRLKNQPST